MPADRLTARGLKVPRLAYSSGDLDRLAGADALAWARFLERVGFRMVWLSEVNGREAFTNAQSVLAATSEVIVGSGVARALERVPKAAGAAAAALVDQYPGRYVLGLGVSGASRARGREPAPFLRDYLDEIDAQTLDFGPAADQLPRVIGAYSPALTKLAARRADGLITVLVPAEHTAWARELMGADPFLAVVQWVIPEEDPERVRRIAREALAYYLTLPHQQAKFRRFGFEDADWQPPGSDRLVDALVAWGSPTTICARLDEHFAAGADQVVVSVPGPPDAAKRRRIRSLAAVLDLSQAVARGGSAPGARRQTAVK